MANSETGFPNILIIYQYLQHFYRRSMALVTITLFVVIGVFAQEKSTNPEANEYYMQGQAHGTRGFKPEDAKTAIQFYEKAIELDSNFALAYAALGRARLLLDRISPGQENLAAAKAALDRAYALAPDMPETQIALGYYHYWGLGDYGQALKHLTAAQEKRPDDVDCLEAKGYIYRRQGNWEKCVANLEKAAQLKPDSYALIVTLGHAYRAMRRYPEAERALNRAISLSPDMPTAYGHRIENCLASDGDIKKARDVLEDATSKVESQALAHYSWILNVFEEKYENALKSLVRGSNLRPYYFRMAWTHHLMKQTELAHLYADSARILLEPLVENDPEDAFLRGSLGECYSLLGRKNEAIREGKKAVELLPVAKDAVAAPQLISILATTYATHGEHDAAIEQLTYLLSIPSSVSVKSIRLDPTWWGPLHKEPRFQEMMAKYEVARK